VGADGPVSQSTSLWWNIRGVPGNEVCGLGDNSPGDLLNQKHKVLDIEHKDRQYWLQCAPR